MPNYSIGERGTFSCTSCGDTWQVYINSVYKSKDGVIRVEACIPLRCGVCGATGIFIGIKSLCWNCDQRIECLSRSIVQIREIEIIDAWPE
jgi:hypothetical protein